MMRWLKRKLQEWLLSDLNSIKLGKNTTTVDTNGVTFGDASVIATGGCSVAQPARAKDTIYQNSTKMRLVQVEVQAAAGEEGVFEIGAGTPPGTIVARIEGSAYVTITALVPRSYYYRLREVAATIVLVYWTEYDLL